MNVAAAVSRWTALGIAGAMLLRFEESGHGPFTDERDKLTDELSRFALAAS